MEGLSFHEGLMEVAAGLPDRAAVFSFAHYADYRGSPMAVADSLRAGDALFEMNAFPSGSVSGAREACARAGAVWIPLKAAAPYRRSSGYSIVASSRGLDDERKAILETLSAARLDGRPCLALVPDASSVALCRSAYRGMLDASIQALSDAVHAMGSILKMEPSMLRMALADFRKEGFDTPLLDAFMGILASMDEEGRANLSVVLDAVKLDSGDVDTNAFSMDPALPQPLAASAFTARALSLLREERVGASASLSGPMRTRVPGHEFLNELRQALVASALLSSAQTLAALGSKLEGDAALCAAVARAWAGSSLLQGPILEEASVILSEGGGLARFLADPGFQDRLNRSQAGLRRSVTVLAEQGIPCPVFSAALSLYDTLRSERLSSNLVAASLDYLFGLGFERADRPRGEYYSIDWEGTGALSRLGMGL
jgi:6-phosphogluconate dehydrogenase